jgi:hypothetical protein
MTRHARPPGPGEGRSRRRRGRRRATCPPLQQADADRFTEAVREALRPLYVEGQGVRIVSEFGWITGTVPGG